MGGAFFAAVLLGLSSQAAAQVPTVRLGFDDWPEDPCASPGDGRCDDAWVEEELGDLPDMRVRACGSGGCLHVGWTADQAIRRVHTPWSPSPDTRTAYVVVRLNIGDDYRGTTSSTGWLNPFYQPLARLHGENPAEFGVDLAIVHPSDQPPVIVLVSAPDTNARAGVSLFRALDETCMVALPEEGGYHTIRAGIVIDVINGDRCQIGVGGESSNQSGLDFGGPVDDARTIFSTASFLGRVSNEGGLGECRSSTMPWPPCGGDVRRSLIVDDLCVSEVLEAESLGLCDPVVEPVDGGTDPLPADQRFRGGGGCECDAGGGPTSSLWLAMILCAYFWSRFPRSVRPID